MSDIKENIDTPIKVENLNIDSQTCAGREDVIVETLSISEFKFWIEGIREMQPKDWTPNREQWDLVLRKINALDTTVVERIVEKEVQVQAPMMQPQYYAQPQQQYYMQEPPSQRRAPPNGGGVPQSEIVRDVDENGREILRSTAPPIDGRPIAMPDGSTKSTFG